MGLEKWIHLHSCSSTCRKWQCTGLQYEAWMCIPSCVFMLLCWLLTGGDLYFLNIEGSQREGMGDPGECWLHAVAELTFKHTHKSWCLTLHSSLWLWLFFNKPFYLININDPTIKQASNWWQNIHFAFFLNTLLKLNPDLLSISLQFISHTMASYFRTKHKAQVGSQGRG